MYSNQRGQPREVQCHSFQPLCLLLEEALEHPTVMRLFVGVPIPSNFFRALLRVAQNEETGKARWTAPEKAHLTLVFLGEVAEARLSSIEREVGAIHAAPLDIRVTHLDSFPRAGVLFAAVAPSARLSHLHTVIASSMKDLGFPQECRPYHPHLTLARFRSGERFDEGRRRLPPSLLRSFPVEVVNLYRSRLTSEGSIYEVMAQKKLGNGGN
jgi:2'-5' RNA ligase